MAVWRYSFLLIVGFCGASEPTVLWHAPFYSGGGYCSEAWSFTSALVEQGIDVKMIHHGDSVSKEFLDGLSGSEKIMLQKRSIQTNTANRLASTAVVVCHSEPGAWHPPRYQTTRCPPADSAYTIGRTMFETDRLPSGWSERLNKMDEVWVPTEFHRGIFQSGGVHEDKLHVLGEAVDTSFFDPSQHSPMQLRGVSDTSFVFLSVFKWEKRKGWDVLLRAYFSEFTYEDDVTLVMLTNAYHGSSDFDSQVTELVARLGITNRSILPRYIILSRVSQVDLPRLYKRAGALVVPSRGEGWGRPHVEAMSMEVPVIATNWSGPTEYLTPLNGYPLEVSGLVQVGEGAFKEHFWAEPSEAHLRQLMRHIFTNRDEATEKGRQARRDMLNNYSPHAMGARLKAEINRIAEILSSKTCAND